MTATIIIADGKYSAFEFMKFFFSTQNAHDDSTRAFFDVGKSYNIP